MPQLTPVVETTRLRLRPYAPQEVLALLEGAALFEQRTGLQVAGGLRDLYRSSAVSPAWLAQLRESNEPDIWLHGFGILLRDSNTLIGACGYKGPPDVDGVVEIAYGLAPEHQGKGYATEAAAALIAFASNEALVRTLRAHTLAEVNASTRVLTKCGFNYIGPIMDPEDGEVWRWERPAEPRQPISGQ